MNKPASIHHPLQQGDKVAYYVQRRVSAGHHTTRIEQIRRTGIVQGWRDGKVIERYAPNREPESIAPDIEVALAHQA